MASKRRLDPHRFDPSPREKRPWEARGWRIRSDLVYSDETLDKAGTRIEELEKRVAELEKPQVGHVTCPECDHEFDFQTSPRTEKK